MDDDPDPTVFHVRAVYQADGIPPALPVQRARVYAQCWNGGSVYYNYVDTRTGDDGWAYIPCNAGSTAAYGGVYLEDGAYVNVVGQHGALVGGGFSTNIAQPDVTIQMINNQASKVYATLHTFAGEAVARMGASRSSIRVTAGLNVDNTFYSPSGDTIAIQQSRTFGQDGYFVALHEYGHAFQHRAIEQYQPSNCAGHDINQPAPTLDLKCAWIEGFADFFAVWLGGSLLDDFFQSGHTSDNVVEANPFRSIMAGGVVDGSRVEGAVAGFLLDLVDAPGQPDGSVVEAFDEVSYSGSQLVSVIRDCVLGLGFNGWLIGVDEFTYCAEQSVAGWPLASNWHWRSYAGSSGSDFWNPYRVHTLWRWNLYNVLE